jgi:parvulin-like peptidyl-prolyl isomerase
MSLIKKLIAAPWLVFLLLGGLGYLLYPNSSEKPLVHISRGQVDAYRDGWRQQYPGKYTPQIEQRLLDQLVAEEVLLHSARDLNLQASPVVQDRLQKLASFLAEDGTAPLADEELIARAEELGLLESDPVIRRYLVSVMERVLVSAVPIQISEQDIDNYYQAHLADYVRPARLDITHVFFSQDKQRTAQDAAAIRANLPALPEANNLDALFSRGDVFYSGHQFAGKNQSQLAALFGSEFASAVVQLPPGEWSAPLRSAYGWHLVWPHNIDPPLTPPLAQVRDKVLARIKQDKEKEVLQEELAKLKQNYEIVIDGSDTPGAAS